jgi:cytochrome P460
MSRLMNKISSDSPIPSAELPPRKAFIQRSLYKSYWLSAAALVALLPFAARSTDDIKIPADYRNWFHVNTLVVGKESPLFEILGGMHVIHVNPDGVAALKKGGPYPDKTIFLDHVHESTLADGAYAEGPLKALTIMVKDSKMYASTGGWGFQAWAGGDPSKPIVTDATKQCFECHTPKKDQDYVYSTYIP